jgi:dTDP-4-dehydrorhamnose 3,5-epimerase
MIKGIKITPLKTFSDERGSVKHMMKCTDAMFKNFGEVYFSVVLPGKVKAWHKNKKTTVNYAVIEGNIKLVVYDGKESQMIYTGEDNYCLITIPPGLWRGFKAIGKKKAIVADLTDRPYDPDDAEKLGPDDLVDCWKD